MPLEEAAAAYDIFDKKEDNNIKVVLKPNQRKERMIALSAKNQTK